MPNQVDGISSRRVVEVHHEDEVGAVAILEVDFSSCLVVYHNQADAGWGSDRPSILVTEAAHSSSDRLLFDRQLVLLS
jgi:hypothetical protein